MQNMGINQLANMFLGNPQPLQQKVQQAQQQAKPGQIPPDLEAAIALQKIQEMRNAAMNQQAMQAGGPQPTVVDQLKQAVSPQATPQGMPQAMARPAPQGLPQGIPQGAQMEAPPPEQPGLPQLPAQLGQHYDGGGIVAFARGGKTKKQQELEDAYFSAQEVQDIESEPNVFVDANGRYSRDLSKERDIYPSGFNPQGSDKTIFYPNGQAENVPAADVQAVTKQPPAGPQAMPAGLASYFQPTNTPAAQAPSEVETYLRKRFADNAEERGAAAEAKAKAAYGAPDTTGYDRAVEELKRRQAQFTAPTTGMPALMEYLQQVALAPKGVGSLTAGAMGAEKINQLQKERETNQFDLAKQILEQEQKKADITRGYAKELYGINAAAVKEAGKEAYDAAIALHKSEDEARKLKQEAELRTAEMLNRKEISEADNKARLAAANAPGQAQQVANRILALEKAGDFEGAARLEKLYASLSGGGNAGVGAERNEIAKIRLQMAAAQGVLKDSRATPEQRTKAQADIAELQKQLASAKAAAPSESVLPPGATTGKVVPGKGTEVLKDGKLIGYAN